MASYAVAIMSHLRPYPPTTSIHLTLSAGRLAVFDDDFGRAEVHLNYAFAHCSKNHPKNKKLVLRYLVPVKLILGKRQGLTIVPVPPQLAAVLLAAIPRRCKSEARCRVSK
jgi:hypothetical protein